MTDLTIYIPTYRRVDRQATWQRLSPRWRNRAFVVAAPDEVDALTGQGCRVLPCPVQGPGEGHGIAHVRQWILDQHDDVLGETVVMIDDDFGKFARRRTDDPTKFDRLLPEDHEGFDQMMDDLAELMDQVVVGGIANRSGANRDTAPFLMNARINGLLAVNVLAARRAGARFDRMDFMEDFDFVLQMLERGYPNGLLNLWVKDTGASNTAGGVSDARDKLRQADSALTLALFHPGLVSITERSSGGWAGALAGTRKDVIVRWKRAYEEGRLKRLRAGQPLVREPDWAGLSII